jgi:hypothetical protein
VKWRGVDSVKHGRVLAPLLLGMAWSGRAAHGQREARVGHALATSRMSGVSKGGGPLTGTRSTMRVPCRTFEVE